jgi:hypothetical protein
MNINEYVCEQDYQTAIRMYWFMVSLIAMAFIVGVFIGIHIPK